MLTVNKTPAKITSELINTFNQELIILVNEFRQLQDVTGSVVNNLEYSEHLLNKIHPIASNIYKQLNLPELQQAFEADVEKWKNQGLDSPPDFTNTQVASKMVEDGEPIFFIGPLMAINGVPPTGFFFECFLAVREEPELFRNLETFEPFKREFPHPKKALFSARLLGASTGFLQGNCLAFFPENIATTQKLESQQFALFFLNKFQPIYLQETIPRVKKIFGNRDWNSAKLSSEDCYAAGSIWGYVHEYFHHTGPRPLFENLPLKLKWYTCLLEELKCDCRVAYTAYHANTIPFDTEILEFILFERILRYTYQPNATRNFDAGTGFLLLQWLLKDNAIKLSTNGGLKIDLEACVDSMWNYANTVEQEVESIEDDDAYLDEAKAFVRKFLPRGEPGQFFAVPEIFKQLINITPEDKLINFENLL